MAEGFTCHGHKRASGGAQAHRKGSAVGDARKRAISAGSGLVLVTFFLAAGCNPFSGMISLPAQHTWRPEGLVYLQFVLLRQTLLFLALPHFLGCLLRVSDIKQSQDAHDE